MGRLTSMPFPAVLIFIIYGHLVLQTNATFFIEVHNRNNGISLYECNVPRTGRSSRSPQSPRAGSSSVASPPSYTTNQDISCTEVTDTIKKSEIYSTANFYLVVNPQLTNGRRIILGSPSTQMPHSIFMGVTIAGDGAADYPALSRDLDDGYVTRLRNKLMVTPPTQFLDADMTFEILVQYMATTDFYQFAYLVEPLDRRFGWFADMVGRVQNVYTEKVAHAWRNRVGSSERKLARSDLKSAAGLLIQKLIDPCFVMSNIAAGESIYREGRFMGPMEVAGIMCKDYCLFLRAVSSLYSNAPGCGLELRDGRCEDRVCECVKKTKLFGCTTGPTHVTMIKCSNDIRTALVGIVNMRLIGGRSFQKSYPTVPVNPNVPVNPKSSCERGVCGGGDEQYPRLAGNVYLTHSPLPDSQ